MNIGKPNFFWIAIGIVVGYNVVPGLMGEKLVKDPEKNKK